MRLIRSFLTCFCFFVFGFGSLIVGCIVFPIVILFYDTEKQKYLFAKIVRKTWRFFVWLMSSLTLIKVSVSSENKGKLKKLKGTVVISNHPTLIDVVILISLIPDSICVVKGALARNFFTKRIVRRAYLLNDDEPEVFLKKAVDFINAGFNIVIFPEGTRTNYENKEDVKLYKGFARIALRAQAPILPVLISSEPRILGKNQKWYDVTDRVSHYQILPLTAIKPPQSSNDLEHKQTKELKQLIQDKLFK